MGKFINGSGGNSSSGGLGSGLITLIVVSVSDWFATLYIFFIFTSFMLFHRIELEYYSTSVIFSSPTCSF